MSRRATSIRLRRVACSALGVVCCATSSGATRRRDRLARMETELTMLRLGVEAWCTETRRLREVLTMAMSDARPDEGEDRPIEVPGNPDRPPDLPDEDERYGGEDPRAGERPTG